MSQNQTLEKTSQSTTTDLKVEGKSGKNDYILVLINKLDGRDQNELFHFLVPLSEMRCEDVVDLYKVHDISMYCGSFHQKEVLKVLSWFSDDHYFTFIKRCRFYPEVNSKPDEKEYGRFVDHYRYANEIVNKMYINFIDVVTLTVIV